MTISRSQQKAEKSSDDDVNFVVFWANRFRDGVLGDRKLLLKFILPLKKL